MISDFSVIDAGFNATDVQFVANTNKAKARLDGALSCKVRKSLSGVYWDRLQDEGFTLSCVSYS